MKRVRSPSCVGQEAQRIRTHSMLPESFAGLPRDQVQCRMDGRTPFLCDCG